MDDLFAPFPRVKFYVGLHQPHNAVHFDRSFISVNRLRRRRGPFPVGDWIMDSGAFTEISAHGRYRSSVREYAVEARRWIGLGHLELIVSQDYMCEPFILDKTGMTVAMHQALTIIRYDDLLQCDPGRPVMPVLQGFAPVDYVEHVKAYGSRLTEGMRVGVGSVCKRNADPVSIIAVLSAIKLVRPDLKLHGFGLKTTALAYPEICLLLYSADSMAWSYRARIEGRDQNDWREAKRFETKILKRMERM